MGVFALAAAPSQFSPLAIPRVAFSFIVNIMATNRESENDGDLVQPRALEASDPVVLERLRVLEDAVKEREVSLLRALRTFFSDFQAFTKGERPDFPRAAAVGLLFAYLRPRVVLVLGSIAAAVLAAIQLGLLLNQNRLIKQQNDFIAQQTQSDRAQAISSILSQLDPRDTIAAEAGMIQMALFSEQGFEALLELSKSESDLGRLADRALLSGASRHTPEQAGRAFHALFFSYWQSPGRAGPFSDGWLRMDANTPDSARNAIAQAGINMVRYRALQPFLRNAPRDSVRQALGEPVMELIRMYYGTFMYNYGEPLPRTFPASFGHVSDTAPLSAAQRLINIVDDVDYALTMLCAGEPDDDRTLWVKIWERYEQTRTPPDPTGSANAVAFSQAVEETINRECPTGFDDRKRGGS